MNFLPTSHLLNPFFGVPKNHRILGRVVAVAYRDSIRLFAWEASRQQLIAAIRADGAICGK
jgi:hypothetical protein